MQGLLHTRPSFGLDDGFVLAIVDLAFELDVAGVNRVCQQPVSERVCGTGSPRAVCLQGRYKRS